MANHIGETPLNTVQQHGLLRQNVRLQNPPTCPQSARTSGSTLPPGYRPISPSTVSSAQRFAPGTNPTTNSHYPPTYAHVRDQLGAPTTPSSPHQQTNLVPPIRRSPTTSPSNSFVQTSSISPGALHVSQSVDTSPPQSAVGVPQLSPTSDINGSNLTMSQNVNVSTLPTKPPLQPQKKGVRKTRRQPQIGSLAGKLAQSARKKPLRTETTSSPVPTSLLCHRPTSSTNNCSPDSDTLLPSNCSDSNLLPHADPSFNKHVSAVSPDHIVLLKGVSEKLTTATEVMQQIFTQLAKLREENARNHSSSASSVVDCISKYMSDSGMTERQQQQAISVSKHTTLLYHYTRYRLCIQFCKPCGVSDLYMWTLEPLVYDEPILMDGATIICNQDMQKAQALLRTTVLQNQISNSPRCTGSSSSPSSRRRSTSDSVSIRRKIFTVAREEAQAQSRLHEALKVEAVCYPLCPFIHDFNI